ncbi:hypothetical protein FRC11_002129, partial [Ceratobasidium sp. 423]
ESRAHVAAKWEDWERGQEVKRQCTEATDPPQAPPKTKARLLVAVEMPSPQAVRTKAPSSNKSNEKGKAPPATKGGHAMSPIDEIELLPIHPGPRPLSDDELELELLTDEWKRRRLIWFLSIRENRNIPANTDYDDLKFILGADSGWSSEDERMDHKVAPQCCPKPKLTAPPPKMTISTPKMTDSTYSAPKLTASGHKTMSTPKTTTSAPKATTSGSKVTTSTLVVILRWVDLMKNLLIESPCQYVSLTLQAPAATQHKDPSDGAQAPKPVDQPSKAPVQCPKGSLPQKKSSQPASTASQLPRQTPPSKQARKPRRPQNPPSNSTAHGSTPSHSGLPHSSGTLSTGRQM